MMISIYELGVLANHTYHPNRRETVGAVNVAPADAITIKGNPNPVFWALMTDALPDVAAWHSFFAGLYIRFDHGQPNAAVLAFRGTVPWHFGNDYEDARMFTSDVIGDSKSDKLPKTLSEVQQAFHHAYWYLAAHFPHQRLNFTTGHSLGGAYAQIVLMQSQYHLHAIAFNAPGIGNLPKVTSAFGKRILNVNSRYGFINKIGKVLGEIVYVDVPNGESFAKKVFEDEEEVKRLQRSMFANSKGEDAIDDIFRVNELEAQERRDRTISFIPQHSMNNLLAAIAKNSIAHRMLMPV